MEFTVWNSKVGSEYTIVVYGSGCSWDTRFDNLGGGREVKNNLLGFLYKMVK